MNPCIHLLWVKFITYEGLYDNETERNHANNKLNKKQYPHKKRLEMN